MKIVKRTQNSTVCVEPIKLNLEVDSYYRLKENAKYLGIAPESIIEYLLEVLFTIKFPLDSIENLYTIDSGIMMIKDTNNNCVYKLLKVKEDENLPK